MMSSTEPPGEHAVAFVAAMVAGALASVQGRMNGELAVRTGEPIEAAVWSFGSGLILLTALLAVPALRRGVRDVVVAVRDGRIKWYQTIGGMAGGLFVAAQSYAVPLVGVALFTIAVVAGQSGNALVVDRLGISPGGPKAINAGRVFAASLAVLGVGIALAPRIASGNHGVALLPVLFALVTGGLSALQLGINARVNVVSGQVLSTTWINFVMGTFMLLLVALGRLAASALHPGWPVAVPWWAWFGGLCGIVFIATAAWAVHHLGVLIYGIALLTGQITVAVALDWFTPATRPDVTPAVLVGVLVTFVAAALASYFARRAARTGSAGVPADSASLAEGEEGSEGDQLARAAR